MVAGGVGDGIEAPQKIGAIAGKVRVIRCSLVQEVESAINGCVAVIHRGRLQRAHRRNRSKKTTEQEAHARIVAKRTRRLVDKQEGIHSHGIPAQQREGWAGSSNYPGHPDELRAAWERSGTKKGPDRAFLG
jgi:hypothetical protein